MSTASLCFRVWQCSALSKNSGFLVFAWAGLWCSTFHLLGNLQKSTEALLLTCIAHVLHVGENCQA